MYISMSIKQLWGGQPHLLRGPSVRVSLPQSSFFHFSLLTRFHKSLLKGFEAGDKEGRSAIWAAHGFVVENGIPHSKVVSLVKVDESFSRTAKKPLKPLFVFEGRYTRYVAEPFFFSHVLPTFYWKGCLNLGLCKKFFEVPIIFTQTRETFFTEIVYAGKAFLGLFCLLCDRSCNIEC